VGVGEDDFSMDEMEEEEEEEAYKREPVAQQVLPIHNTLITVTQHGCYTIRLLDRVAANVSLLRSVECEDEEMEGYQGARDIDEIDHLNY